MTMLRKIYGTAVVLVLCLVLAASCKTPAGNEDTSLSFLWEVSSDTNTVYILGSVHVARANIYPLSEAIENAYETADYLVVEVNTNAISELDMTILLMDKGRYPAGESLRENVTDDLYKRLSDRLEELYSGGALLNSMNVYEPWVVALTIADLDYMELGYEAEYGLETYFLDKAESDNKDILELESAEFQLDIFDSMSYNLQIAMLKDAVDNPLTEDEIEAMFEAWSTGDTETMEQIVFEDIEEDEYNRILTGIIIDERNFQMLEKIEQYLEDDETYFVVVGAGHLVGENGIINLLDGLGYTVEQQ